MQKISPCLWFDDQAEDAAKFYVSLFKNSKILDISYYPDGAPRPAGMVMMVVFSLDGLEVQALNGGPEYKLTEAFSLSIKAETQEEIDMLWERLSSDGGMPGPCGWVKDKFGVSWQVYPPLLDQLLADPDPNKAKHVMQAMLGMGKIVIADLQVAYDSSDKQ